MIGLDGVNLKTEEQIQTLVAQFANDPLGFVQVFYSWGRGVLDGETGPDKWQQDVLKEIGKAATNGTPLRLSVSSGHGVGKTALVAWIVQWFISTRPNPQIVVTANTKDQLNAKTWRELAKWQKLCLNGHWFKWTATRYAYRGSTETWFAAAIPWSAERSDAFAGTHEKHVLVVFDEASSIDDIIWEVTEGAMTTKGAMWLAFGNPTKNSGRFYSCFHDRAQWWVRRQVDSRNAKAFTEKKEAEKWALEYGEDSDFFRVRVKGEFPRQSSMQFIGSELAEEAAGRTMRPEDIACYPKVLGVDVARFGDDQTVLYVRQGFMTLEILKFRNLDTMAVADLVGSVEDKHKVDASFVDVIGVGAGVVDRLRQLGRYPISVVAGERSVEPNKYYNKRCEMWDAMRQWLKDGGCIPYDKELILGLTAPEYMYDQRGRIVLERKEDLKRRGLSSPDVADALAHTFAAPVMFKGQKTMPWEIEKPYDPFTYDVGGTA